MLKSPGSPTPQLWKLEEAFLGDILEREDSLVMELIVGIAFDVVTVAEGGRNDTSPMPDIAFRANDKKAKATLRSLLGSISSQRVVVAMKDSLQTSCKE